MICGIISSLVILQGICIILYTVVILCYLKGSSDAILILPLIGSASVIFGCYSIRCHALLYGLVLEAFILLVMFLIYIGGRSDIEENINAIIILGNGLNAGNMSPLLINRLNKARDVCFDLKVDKVIVTGGTPKGQDMCAEACVMKRYLVNYGINETSIITETESNSTKENFENISRLISKETRVAIVTDRFHMARASKIASDIGFKKVSKIPAKQDAILAPYYYLREMGCWIMYYVRRIRNEKI